jgi:hypothetical protein
MCLVMRGLLSTLLALLLCYYRLHHLDSMMQIEEKVGDDGRLDSKLCRI